MKKLLTLLSLLLFCMHLIGQADPWSRLHAANFFTQAEHYGAMLETENMLMMITGKDFREYSHDGELLNSIALDDTALSGRDGYFFMDQLQAGNDDYLLIARRGGTSGNIYLYTYFKNGIIPEAFFELADNISDDLTKAPAGVKTDDGSYLFFGQDQIYKINVPDPFTIEIEWSKPNTGGAVAAAINTDNGYVTCSQSGTINKYDNLVELEWSTDLGYPLFDLDMADNGYITCGTNNQDLATLEKTSTDGTNIWTQTYQEKDVYGLDVTNDQNILFAGKEGNLDYYLTKTDDNGNEIWTVVNEDEELHPAIQIMESRYGNLWLHSYGPFGSSISNLSNDGNHGETYVGKIPNQLDINNITTTTSTSGPIFNDQNFSLGYKFPANSNTNTLFSAGLWIGGYDQSNELHITASSYDGDLFVPGPIGNNSVSFWNNVFTVDKYMIHKVVQDLNDGVQNEPIPIDILWWPGQGNPNITVMGVPIEINEPRAPFEDVNNDGIYNVYDGDYPKIKGDKMLWWLMNDNSTSNPLNLGIEVAGSIYAFECDDPVLNNSSFLELSIHNKSGTTYSDVKAALFSDFDIGCYTDDYLGIMPDLNTYYAYNSDSVDDDCLGATSFDSEIPIQSITFLNQDINNFMYDGTIPGLPNIPFEQYAFMESIWPDGSHLTYGGTGVGGSTDSDFAFPGNPTIANDWSMCQVNSFLGDNRAFPATDFTSLEPGGILELHFGLLTHTDIDDLPCPDVSQIEFNLEILQNFYDNILTTGTLTPYVLDLGPDIMYEAGETYTLDAGAGGGTYLWSTGATSQTINVDTEGIYSVTVNSTIGCAQVDSILVDANLVSTQELSIPLLNIYPNPTNGQLSIDLDNEVPVSIQIFNMIGQQVRAIQTEAYAPSSTITLNLSDEASGIYLINAKYRSGKQSIQRVVLGR